MRTLGGLGVERDGSPLEGLNSRRKRLALLAVLSAAGSDGLARDKLLALLWPESTDDQARNALNQAVFGLRRELGADAIIVGAELRLNPAAVANDVSDFRRAINAGELETAVHLYGGPFLDGFGLKGAREFELWADEERRRLAAMHGRALEDLADRATAAGDTTAAVTWWRRRADTEPFSARIAHALMRALVAAGEREAALQHASLYAEVVRAELDAEPDPSIAAFAEQIRKAAPKSSTACDDLAEPELPDRARQTVDLIDAGLAAPRVISATRTRKAPWLLGAAIAAVAVGTALFLAAPTAVYRGPLAAIMAPVVRAIRGDQPLDTLPRVQITVFQNRTGDQQLDQLGETLADWIGQGVVQTGLVEVIPAQTALWRARGSSGRGHSAAPNATAIAKSTGAGLVITGDYYGAHDSLYVESSLIDASSGRLIGSAPAVPLDAANPYPAIERVRQRIMGVLATSVDIRLKQWATAASQPTTFDAYREFSDGLSRIMARDEQAALLHLERARQLDTNFMLPALWSLYLYGDARRREADSVVRYLEARRDRLTSWDRAMLDYQRAGLDQYPIERYAAIQDMLRFTPGSAWLIQAAGAALAVDRPRDVVADLSKLDPSHLDWALEYWGLLNAAYHRLGKFDRALAAVDRMQELRPDRKELFSTMRVIAFGAMGNVREVEGIIANDSAAPADRLSLFSLAIQEAAVHDHRAVAMRLLDALDTTLARLPTSRRQESHVQERRGLALLAVGRAKEALAIGRTIGSPRLVALSSAVLGDRRAADSAVAVLLAEPRPPRDLLPRSIQVRVAVLEGDRARAQQLLREFVRDGRWWDALHSEPGAAALRGYPSFALLVARR